MELNNIAQLAYRMAPKDKNRDAVYEIAMKLIEDKSLSEHEIAVLYAQGLDSRPAKPRKPEKWVANAVAKDDIREYLQYIYSDGKRIMGTDGHRLHIWKTDKYPEGFYNPKTMKKASVPDSMRFPSVDRVIPNTRSDDCVSSAVIELAHAGSVTGRPLVVYKVGPAAVNAHYLDAALDGFSGVTTLIHYIDENHAIKIETDNKLAVVMPVRQ